MMLLRLLLAGTLTLLWSAWAQGIPYTVQVLAVSDQEAALSVQRDLLSQSFPAYVVRAAVAQGDLYRVRVGAFANRTAALVYAEAMDPVEGSQPLPALAEGIPAGVMPLQPRVLAQLEAPFEIYGWSQGLALRFQPDPAAPATYRVLSGDESVEFEAWRAQPDPAGEGILRVRNMPLWPSSWQEDAVEVREAYMQQVLRNVAGELGATVEELTQHLLRPAFGPPYLVVLEGLSEGAQAGRVIGVAAAAGEPSGFGPGELAVGAGDYPAPVEPLYSATPGSEPTGEEFSGEGWRVQAQGEFFLLAPASAGSGWRAGVGTPLWSDGTHLLSRTEAGLLLYDFLTP